MKPLDIKLMRDFRRLWAQALAIALVAAAGVMTLIIGLGTYRSLSETQTAYYERYNFADIFASATRVPNQVLNNIAAIPGVARAEARVQQIAILDIEGLSAPATGMILSLPDVGEPSLNRLFLQTGREPDPLTPGEVLVSGPFAEAHQFGPGDSFYATMGGVKRRLDIVGTALSPEYVYSLGPSDGVPDNKRFGIIWMRYSDLAASFDLKGAFNEVSLQLPSSASEAAVIEAVDEILKPFGGRGAYGRAEQISHAFLDSELTQLRAMSYIMPPIFLGVAAFLVNMTLARLITLEREQIGLLKALGYRSSTIAWHYVKLALAIAAVGIVIGWGFGAWTTRGLAKVYAEFYKFPFLLFQDRPDVFAAAATAALAAAGLGTIQAVRSAVRLSAAVAMAPPAPPVYRRFILDRLGLTRHIPQGLTMALRSLMRQPARALLTVLGIGLATSLLVSGLFSENSFNYMIEATFFKAERQQASLSFSQPVSPSAIESVGRLPGVMITEQSRAVPVKFSNGLHEKRASIIGKPLDTDLSRVIDENLEPVALAEYGLVLSKTLANILKVRIGDIIEAEILDGGEKILQLPVSQIIQQFVGLGAYMEIGALNKVLGEASMANGANLTFDELQTDALYQAVKDTPAVVGITLYRRILQMLRETIGENIGMSRAVYVTLAVIIVFGVVYNSMRIQLSERARELASLRVLGFTRVEVSVILLSELAILTMIAIPAGWLLGYLFAYGIAEGLQSDLYTFPLVITRATYATAGLVVLGATIVSAYIVQRRVARLDLVAVLKTRD